MKLSKVIAVTLASMLTLSSLVGCGANKPQEQAQDATSTSQKEVKITMLNTKGEIQVQLEDAAKIFMEENPGIVLEVLPAAEGTSPFEKLSAMYGAGNAPTLAMVDPADVPKFADKFKDMSDAKWVEEASEGTLDITTIDGKIKAFPLTVEGFGFIYNKGVLDKAGVDPNSINTQEALEDAFQKVEDSGAKALVIAPLDWSLGAHFLSLAYATQSEDFNQALELIEDLKAGTVNLADNKKFNGIMDTFEIMKKYNAEQNDPLAVTYEKGPEMLGKSEVGFWFMGNWAWPLINEFDEDKSEFGFVPVPTSNDPQEYGNTGISVGVAKVIGLDETQNTDEQQEAGAKFLEWLVYSESGQDVIVNKANMVPIYKNNAFEAVDPLARSIGEYLAKESTIKNDILFPGDHWAKVGGYLQKNLAGKADRAETFSSIEEYWKTVD